MIYRRLYLVLILVDHGLRTANCILHVLKRADLSNIVISPRHGILSLSFRNYRVRVHVVRGTYCTHRSNKQSKRTFRLCFLPSSQACPAVFAFLMMKSARQEDGMHQLTPKMWLVGWSGPVGPQTDHSSAKKKHISYSSKFNSSSLPLVLYYCSIKYLCY